MAIEFNIVCKVKKYLYTNFTSLHIGKDHLNWNDLSAGGVSLTGQVRFQMVAGVAFMLLVERL